MILVLIDQDRGEIDPLSLRALTAARKMGQDVEAVVIGGEGAALATIAGEYGATTLHVATHSAITDYTPMASGRALKDLVEKLKPAAVLAAGSPQGNEQLAHSRIPGYSHGSRMLRDHFRCASPRASCTVGRKFD